MAAKPLGRRVPTDFEHIDKYPLSALRAAAVPKCVPVTLGVNWYSAFDSPVKVGSRWWIGRDGNLGTVRGGHCVCCKPDSMSDPVSWYDFYNQGSEGACVGFGHSRLMSLLNGKRYFARWLWDQAKMIDEWAETNPGDNEGTSCRAACEVLRSVGHVVWRRKYLGIEADVAERDALPPTGMEGIAVYRWATTVDEVRTVLASPRHDKLQAVPILNSWGRDYPHIVWMPYSVLERLISEDGEVALVTDR